MKQFICSTILLVFSTKAFCQDTFSIVAVDTNTMEVGSAGASCIDGSIIISDILPGIGAVHTQSFWNQSNQENAHNWMEEGYTAQEIINMLINNDAQNNPSIRQYGIVNFDLGLRSAAYTGDNCYNYKNHIIGPNYAIQGNILLGPRPSNANIIGQKTIMLTLVNHNFEREQIVFMNWVAGAVIVNNLYVIDRYD